MQEVNRDQQFSEEESVEEWSTQDFGPPIFITLARIYDLLSLIAISVNPTGAGQILAMHEQGLIKGALPSLQAPVETEDENTPIL
jgi:hypothetical protein